MMVQIFINLKSLSHQIECLVLTCSSEYSTCLFNRLYSALLRYILVFEGLGTHHSLRSQNLRRSMFLTTCFSLCCFYPIFVNTDPDLGRDRGAHHSIYSQFSMCVTARGSCTGLVTVGPTKIFALRE